MNDKMNKVKQMDKVLEMYYLLRFNQQEVETMNRQITSNKTELIIIIKIPTHKGAGPGVHR